MAYAEKTTVPVGRSQDEIRKILSKHGASAFGIMESKQKAMLTFEMKGKRIVFKLPLPPEPSAHATQASLKTYDQLFRTKWRALTLAIKAKLECVESGITTLEQEFLAHTVLPDGSVFGEIYIPQIDQSYRTQQMPPLLGGRST
jgi:hypothetical protein